MSETTFGAFTPAPDGIANLGIGPGVVPQPGMSINYKSDGSCEGQVKYRCDVSDRGNLPGIGATHPLEARAICHDISIEYVGNRIIEATGSFHGIDFGMGESTPPTIEYPGSVDQMPIQIHPRFTIIAGTPASVPPVNGARWVDPVTREVSTADDAEFDGFRDPAFPTFYGVEVFFQSRPLVYRTYWSNRPPVVQEGCTIVDRIPGFTNPPGITNWLLLDTPFQQVGKNAYRVTEQYKGSPAPGWNPSIYRKP
jgi:hypothetical protein